MEAWWRERERRKGVRTVEEMKGETDEDGEERGYEGRMREWRVKGIRDEVG